jgi:hypothetical protein
MIKSFNIKKITKVQFSVLVVLIIIGGLSFFFRYQLNDLYLSLRYSKDIEKVHLLLSVFKKGDDNAIRRNSTKEAHALRPDVLQTLKSALNAIDIDELSVLYARHQIYVGKPNFFVDFYLNGNIDKSIRVSVEKSRSNWLIQSIHLSEPLYRDYEHQ